MGVMVVMMIALVIGLGCSSLICWGLKTCLTAWSSLSRKKTLEGNMVKYMR